jgi:diguanylate cyclase (GGDEF)-like protein
VLFAPLLTLWLLAFCGPAAAQEYVPDMPAARCHTGSSSGENFVTVLAQPSRWNCSKKDWSINSDRAYLWIDLRGRTAPAPNYFTARLTRFESIKLIAIGTDGMIATRELREADMTLGTADWLMSAPLPKVASPTAAIVVQVDKARHAGVLSDARMTNAGQISGGSIRQELMISILYGMLTMPLLFNLVFYLVLRARFLIWHALAASCMLGQTFVSSGLVNRFFDLSIAEISIWSVATFAVGIIAAMLFSADLIEPGKLDPFHRKLLRRSCLWVLGWSVIYLVASGPFRPYAAPLYYASFLPLIALFIWVMAVARIRGSRAVYFQIAAWLPFMLTGGLRVISNLGAADTPLELQIEQHIALALEIVITTLGVADRLLIIRRERDRAWAEAGTLQARAERDPLTGLLNRRGVEERFEELYQVGFRAMAVIDLDRFKDVNDSHGHAVGDEVLRAVADALVPDDDTVAVRMGGEEFLLLMRGGNTAEEAERRRQAIPTRAAARVPGLDRMITASMGFVEQPDDTLRGDFALLYAHCDRLLYDAKAAGRNRAMCEKMQSFAKKRRRVSLRYPIARG